MIVIGWLFVHVFVFYAVFFYSFFLLFSLFVVSILCHACILCLNLNREEVFYEPSEEAVEGLASAVQHISRLAVSTMGLFCQIIQPTTLKYVFQDECDSD